MTLIGRPYVRSEAVLGICCSLCYTAIAFDRHVDGEARDLSVSGLLRESDLVLYYHQTTTFEDARAQYPDALALSCQTGFIRS